MAKRGTKEWKKKIGDANRGVWVVFSCDFCEKECTDKQSHYKRKKRHFCGHGCYAKYREEVQSPNETNTWKGGITKETQRGRGSKRYKLWQQMVFERDGHKCVWCKGNTRLEADHIKRWSTHPELRYKVTNGRTICMKCHNKTRSKKYYENPDLINNHKEEE